MCTDAYRLYNTGQHTDDHLARQTIALYVYSGRLTHVKHDSRQQASIKECRTHIKAKAPCLGQISLMLIRFICYSLRRRLTMQQPLGTTKLHLRKVPATFRRRATSSQQYVRAAYSINSRHRFNPLLLFKCT